MEQRPGRLIVQPGRYAPRLWVVLAWPVCAGCAPQWHLQYQDAEYAARAQEQPLVVFYKDPWDSSSSQMEDLLEGPQAAPLLAGKVRCMLTTDFPPYRKYVAQYGVSQAPALILIHPDGTYHAHNGAMTLERIRAFFTNALPPGAKPVLSPQIPRTIDYRYYRWEGVYGEALAKARRQNRRLLLVYKWWLSAECNELLATLHTRPEVARHFAETVNCLLDRDYSPNRTHVRRYGVTNVPAMILLHRDGTYHAHTGPMTAEQIVRFVTASKPPGQVPGAEPVERTATRTNYRWYTDFSRAQAHARNRGVDLFVFFDSMYSDPSARMARLLERSDVAALFADTINCRLDFSVAANRQVMARHRIRRAPAFLIIRTDGTYHGHTGVASAEELATLVRAARKPGLIPRPADIVP
jgi:hypothetical protein